MSRGVRHHPGDTDPADNKEIGKMGEEKESKDKHQQS